MATNNNTVYNADDKMSWDVASACREQWNAHNASTERMAYQVQSMMKSAENTRQAYNRVVAERDAFRAQLQNAESRLADVQRVLQRYAVVSDPVVASDGYTYERKTVQQYFDECAASSTSPVSQQTKEPLTTVLTPNQSLKKLVELLRSIKPQEIPAAQQTSATSGDPVATEIQGQQAAPAVHPTLHEQNAAMQAAQLQWSAMPNMAPPPPPPTAMPPQTDGGASSPGGARMHPCIRVYGFCNYKEGCAYAKYPFEACLSHLKGKCRFGQQCHELHVDFKKPAQQQQPSPAAFGRPQMQAGATDNSQLHMGGPPTNLVENPEGRN